MGPGIYLILNTTDAKVYVGSATTPRKRINSHRSMLRQGSHHSPRLQRAFARDGEAAFSFKVIEFCPTEHLLVREQYWMNYFAAFAAGYNAAPVAGTRAGVPQPASVSAKMKAFHTGKPKSAEQRARMSAAAKGRKKSPEHKAAIAAAVKRTMQDPARRAAAAVYGAQSSGFKGHKVSDAAKQSQREKALAKLTTPESRAAMVARIPKRTREQYVESARKREAAKAARRKS